LKESLSIITLGTVSILELEPTLSFLLLFEKEKDRTSGEGFLETEEIKTLLEEYLTM